MALSVARRGKGGGQYCVAGGPNGASCKNGQFTEGISVHRFPQVKSSGPEADKLKENTRRSWIKFVQRHRRGFQPSKSSVLCSAHFEPSCFTKHLGVAESCGTFRRRLVPGAVPTLDTVGLPTPTAPDTERTRRQVVREVLAVAGASAASAGASASPSSAGDGEEQDGGDGPDNMPVDDHSELQPPTAKICSDCVEYKRKIRTLQKNISRLRREKGGQDKDACMVDDVGEDGEEEEEDKGEEEVEEEGEEEIDLEDEGEEEDVSDEREEDTDYSLEEESSSAESLSSEEDDGGPSSSNVVTVEPGCHSFLEPKFLVFYSMLASLFNSFCFKCKLDKPRVTVKRKGTMAVVSQSCKSCGDDSFTWRSQPFVFGQYPAGNILMSFGILMSGISISKTLLLFKHIGLSMFSARTFFYHQRKFIFPAVLTHWESYRKSLIDLVKGKDNTSWSGDGRYDSMGHNAKYGAYTMFCNTVSKLVHFELLQSNQSGSSNAMELDGAKRCFAFLSAAGVKIATFITDRHRGIVKWMREEQKGTVHMFDLWHVAKSLVKELHKAGKEKGCEIITEWLRSLKKHLYWCALSTTPGFGELIAAKWESIIRHVSGKHDNHPNRLFSECAHGPLEQERKWIYSGSLPHDKLSAIVLKKDRIKDIKMLSSENQTSCLEGFHSTLNHWHPKMTHFSWMGSYCRHVLAVLHFNENLKRQRQTTADGKICYRVTYPKFKLGEETVKEVPAPPTYDYVSDVMNVMLKTSKGQLLEMYNKYSQQAPPPLCSQFTERRPRQAAIQRFVERNQRPTELFPIQQEQSSMRVELEAEAATEAATSRESNGRKTRTCRTCKQPMKGHRRGTCSSTAV